MSGDPSIVRNQNDRDSAGVEAVRQRHDLVTGHPVQATGRFVGRNERRIAGERAHLDRRRDVAQRRSLAPGW